MFLEQLWKLFAQRTSTETVQLEQPRTIDCSRHPSFNDIPNYWDVVRAEVEEKYKDVEPFDQKSSENEFNDSVQADIKPTYSEFEKRTALIQFKRLATTECLAKIAQGFSDDELIDEFHQLVKLADVFSVQSPIFDNYMSSVRFTQTIKRRDADYMAMLANDLHRPGCMDGSPAYEQKLHEIAFKCRKPELTIVT